jgi:hypothetical protein
MACEKRLHVVAKGDVGYLFHDYIGRGKAIPYCLGIESFTVAARKPVSDIAMFDAGVQATLCCRSLAVCFQGQDHRF